MIKSRLNFLGLIMIVISFVTSYTFALPDPVGMWLFEEGSGAVVSDSSPKENHGTIMGDVAWGAGKFGDGLVFDGVEANYVEIPDSDSLDMKENISVVFWFMTTKAMTEENRWGDRQVPIGKFYEEYEIGIYDSGFVHTYTGKEGGYDEGIMVTMADTIDPEFEVNKWYHLAWTLDGKIETVYINGMMIGETFEKENLGTKQGENPLEIGRRTGGGLPFSGTIDEVGVYNVTLSAADIKEIAEGAGLAGATTAVDPASKLTTIWGSLKKQR